MKQLLIFLAFALISTAAYAAQPDPTVFQEWDCKYRFVDIDQDDEPDVIQVHYYSPDADSASDVDAYYLIGSRELVGIVWADSEGTEYTWTRDFTLPGHAAAAAPEENVVKRSF